MFTAYIHPCSRPSTVPGRLCNKAKGHMGPHRSALTPNGLPTRMITWDEPRPILDFLERKKEDDETRP